MFHQLLTPVGNSLGLSFLVAILPVLTVLILLGVFRRPAWQAALAGLIVGIIVAVGPWQMPIQLALHSVLNGATFAMWPVMWPDTSRPDSRQYPWTDSPEAST